MTKIIAQFILLICFFTMGIEILWGQASTVEEEYQRNRFWIRTKELPSLMSVQDWEKISEMRALKQEYEVKKISHPLKTRSHALDNTYLVEFENESKAAQLKAFLENLPYIQYVEREPIYRISYTPNDYTSAQQYFIQKTQTDLAWDLTKGDTNVVIAIVDAAVMTNHPDLQANIYKNWAEINGTTGVDDDNNGFIDDTNGWDVGDNDNDPNPPQVNNFDHGTHVAGCASAVADNGIGVAGVGFKCRLLPIKAKSNGSTGSSLDATLGGVDYAVASKITNVINMSFGGTGSSQTWQALIDAAYHQNIVVVAAAGNNNDNADNFFPASYNHVISVGATNLNDIKASFSNYGTKIDVMAPGVAIRSTTVWGVTPPVSGYANWDGTSMASPVVAGIVGLMLSANSNLNPDAVETCLKQTCDNINSLNPGYIGLIGAGRVNAYQAVSCVIPSVLPIASFNYQTIDVCGGEVQFTNTSQNLQTTWTWDFGNGQTSNLPNPLVFFGTSGTYNVKLIVSNPIGNDTNTQTLQINALPVPIVNAGTDIMLCTGNTITLNGTSTLAGTAVWSPNIGLSSTNILNPTASPTSTRTYVLTVTTADECIGLDSITVTVNPSPTVWAGNDVTINLGDSTQLSPAGSNNLTYSWTPSTGLSNPNIKSPKASPSATTYYQLTVTNASNCQKSDWILVTVNWGGVSIEKTDFPQLQFYPNPAETSIEITGNFPNQGELSLKLLDLTGKTLSTLYEGFIQNPSFQLISLLPFPTGMYFIETKWNGKLTYTKLLKK